MNGFKHKLAPLSGIGFLILVIVAFAVQGEPPGADHPAQEIVDHYVDNKDSIQISAYIASLAAVLFVYFGAYLSRTLRNADPDRGILPAVVFAGTVIFAVALAIDSTILIALADSAKDIDPSAVQALQAFYDNDFVPFALGVQLFILASGLSILLHGGLPRWMGWIAVVIGVVALTPLGFFAVPATALWVLIASVLLTRGTGVAPAANRTV